MTLGEIIIKITAHTGGLDAGVARSVSGLGLLGRSAASSSSLVGKSLAGMAIGAGVVGASTIKMAADFEAAFARVKKVLDPTTTDLKQLEAGIVSLSTKIPVAATELAEMAAMGGQMGIVGAASLLKFTETVARLGSVAEMSGEQAAMMLARIAQVNHIPIDKIDKLGSSVVAVADSFNATTPEVLRMVQQMQGLGSQAGLTAQQMIGLAATIASSGIRIEAGGTAMARIASDISKAVTVGGEKLEKFAKVSGMTADQFKKSWSEDKAATLFAMLSGIAAHGENAARVLDQLGFKNVRVAATAGALAKSKDDLRKAIELANREFDKGSALVSKSDTIYSTFNAQLKQVKEQFKALGIAIATPLLPDLKTFVSLLQSVIGGVSAANSKLPQLGEVFLAIATAGIHPALKALRDWKTELSKMPAIHFGAFQLFGGGQGFNGHGASGSWDEPSAGGAGVPPPDMGDDDKELRAYAARLQKAKFIIQRHFLAHPMDGAGIAKAFSFETDQMLKDWETQNRNLITAKNIIARHFQKNPMEGMAPEKSIDPEYFIRLGRVTDELNAKYQKWRDTLSQVRNVFQILGISAESILGRLLGGAVTIGTAFADLQRNMSSIVSDGKGGFSSKFDLKNMWKDDAGKFSISSLVNNMSSVLQAGAAVFSIGKAIAGLFHAHHIAQVAKEAGAYLGVEVSKALAEQIDKTAKSSNVSVKIASLLNLDKVMDESKKAASSFGSQLGDLMRGLANGTVPAKEGLDQLSKAFTKLVEEGTDAAKKLTVEILQFARATGNVTAEMKNYVGDLLDKAAKGVHDMIASGSIAVVTGFRKIKDGIGKDGKDIFRNIPLLDDQATLARAKSQGYIFAAAFWATVKEKGLVAAAKTFQEDWNAFKDQLAKANIPPDALKAITDPIDQVMRLLNDEALKSLVEGLDGATRAVSALGDAGYMTQGAFQGLAQQAQSTYDEILASTGDSNLALMAIAPTLAELARLAEMYGIELDDNTKKLIEQAKASGIAFPTDPLQAIVDLLGQIVSLLGGIPGAANKAGNALKNMPANVPGAFEPGGPGSHNPNHAPEEHAAFGFYSPKLPKDTLIAAHTGEEVMITPAGKSRKGGTVDVDKMLEAMAQAAGGRSDGGDIVMHNTLNLDGKAFGEWITRATKTGNVRIHESSVRSF